MIFGCSFIRGSKMFQFLNNLKDAVALLERFINFEPQLGRVFENDGLADEALNALALPVELGETRALLPGIAENADIPGSTGAPDYLAFVWRSGAISRHEGYPGLSASGLDDIFACEDMWEVQ